MIGKIQHKQRLDADGEWQDFKTFILDGKEVTEAEWNKAFPPQPLVGPNGEIVGGMPLKGYPFVSEAMAVHPDQIPEAREHAIKNGVPTDFDSEGRPVVRDRQHKKELCRALGYFDRDAGYGDQQRGSFKGYY